MTRSVVVAWLLVIGLVILGLWLVPEAVWERLDGVSPGSKEVGGEHGSARSYSLDLPAGTAGASGPRLSGLGVSLPEPVREELARDCDPEEIASAIAEARVYRESMVGRTATEQSALSPIIYRTLHGMAAVALEGYIQRCMQFIKEDQ